MSDRHPISQPLTPAEERVVEALAEGLTYREAAANLGISLHTAETHANNAGKKVPGDLPLQLRLVAWHRGQPTWVLTPR